MNKPILLVEDNPDDVELTLRAFRKSNIVNEIIVARDGEMALDMLFGEKRIVPAVVLLDLKLPKIDGLEVLRRIRESAEMSLLPVVILTSSREENDLLDGYRGGANSYIRKPVDFERFIDAVKTLGVYWLILNEPPPCRP
ncbi:MAG TPA: response regulator [Spirochaetota bacterium]|nr:response regulator [Spirochaetota bacterium]HPV42803.1 response regulator [Spirochaetota bacterium]